MSMGRSHGRKSRRMTVYELVARVVV